MFAKINYYMKILCKFLSEVESLRTHFEVLGLGLEAQALGLGLEASSPQKLACPWLKKWEFLAISIPIPRLEEWKSPEEFL